MEYLVVRLEAGHLDFLVPRTVNCNIDYLVVRLEADHLDFSCHNCELYHHLKLRMAAHNICGYNMDYLVIRLEADHCIFSCHESGIVITTSS